jgi:hypothetical protein
MSPLYRQLNLWMRKTASSFAPLLVAPDDALPATASATEGRVYRLRQWPALPSHWRTARIYRVLAVMSQRPVNRHWLVARQGMAPSQTDALISYLVTQDAVDIVDVTAFAPAPQ